MYCILKVTCFVLLSEYKNSFQLIVNVIVCFPLSRVLVLDCFLLVTIISSNESVTFSPRMFPLLRFPLICFPIKGIFWIPIPIASHRFAF